MREGGLDAPKRHPIAWRDEDFYDPEKLDAELRRVFDICHGCRRCFNLCDSFPRLFDLIDASPSGELDGVASADFAPVVEACTLCDMCFMTKCPYVPPHPFALDFPHLMLRQRAVAARAGAVKRADRELAKTDRNGRLATLAAPLANWATKPENHLARAALEKTAGLHREAELPKYASHSLTITAAANPPALNREAPGFGRKAVLYATCFGNYNDTETGLAARAVLARNGVETEILHPRCCGMPLLEQGLLGEVAAHAEDVARAFAPWIARGFDVIALVPSCALMLKFEWPLLLPGNEAVRGLADATYDVSEYIVDIARKNGLAPGLQPVPGGVTLHMACHARAQNMGQKAADMLRLIPELTVSVVERCSGHGGAWGFKRENFPVALKIGRPAARAVKNAGQRFVTSECPLAGVHLHQTMARDTTTEGALPELLAHPICLLARSYGLDPETA
jgi:glycerol-3-phosphate dehydrogenase subunit C